MQNRWPLRTHCPSAEARVATQYVITINYTTYNLLQLLTTCNQEMRIEVDKWPIEFEI